MVELRTSPALAKLVACTLLYTDPSLLLTHLQYIHNYILSPDGHPLKANAGTLTELNIYDVLDQVEERVDAMEAAGQPTAVVERIREEIDSLQDGLAAAASRTSTGYASPSSN
jgi:hypothetical protein